MSPTSVAAAVRRRIRSALLVVVVCVALSSVAAVVQLLPAPVEEQSLALGGSPDQSRTSVVGDASVDTAWQGIWKRKPAALAAVTRELDGYEGFTGSAHQVPKDAAVAQGMSILKGYSGVLGSRTATQKPAVNLAVQQRNRLYDAFMLQGGTKAQLYDAAAHNQELNAYKNVLSFDDKLPAQAVDGPLGKAVKSSTDELSSYSSILDFSTPVPEFGKAKTVRSHKNVLSFANKNRDLKRIKEREANHHVLSRSAVSSEHDSYNNILSFPGDERDAESMRKRKATPHGVDASSRYLAAERKAHSGIFDFSHAPDEQPHVTAVGSRSHSDDKLEGRSESKELSSYNSILEFPGERELNALQHPRKSSKELKSYSDILDFEGHAAKSKQPHGHTHTSTTPQSTAGDAAILRGPAPSKQTSNLAAKAEAVHPVGAPAAAASGAAGSKVAGNSSNSDGGEEKGVATMLLETSELRQTTQQEKATEEKAILIEPPQRAAGSPIAKKLAHLYREAKKLISEETHPSATKLAAAPASKAAKVGSATQQLAHVVRGESQARRSALRHRRRLSRDPVLRRLQRQAAELRARLRKVQVKKAERAVEKDALSHVLQHKENLLKLDESLEHKLTRTDKSVVKRAGSSMSRMIDDDEATLQALEAAAAQRAAAKARRQARQAGLVHLTAAQKKNLVLEREHALLLAKIHELRKHLPKAYSNGFVSKAVEGGRKAALAEAHTSAATQQLVQLDTSALQAPLSSEAKIAYARKLARAEQLLQQARSMAHAIMKKNSHVSGEVSAVAKVDMDLEGIANVLKDRALHVVLDGKSSDEHLHHSTLHELVDAAAAHADIFLGGGEKGAADLEHKMEELRKTAEQDADGSRGGNGRQQVLRALLAQERARKSRLRRAMKTLHRHVGGPRARKSVMQKMEAALERSGDYVVPLHAAPVVLPQHAKDSPKHGKSLQARARDGAHAQHEEEAQWAKDKLAARNVNLLSQSSDSTEVLSLEGREDEDKTLKSDISALVDATQHKDVKQYDAMLKAAIKKSEKKLASFESAQGSESHAVWSRLASADKVFAQPPKVKVSNDVQDAMAAAARIEKQLHLKFDKKGSIYQEVLPEVKKARLGKNYIPGLGKVEKQESLMNELFTHHRVPLARAEAMEAPKLHKLSARTRSRLTDHAVFKPKGVRRVMSRREPNAWHIVDKDADTALEDGSEVGTDVAEATGSLFAGLTRGADSRKASGDDKANSLWHYV